MDIEYLLLLQNLRNTTNGVFNGFFEFITEVAVDFFIVMIPLIIYWTIDKKKGMFIYCAHGFGCLINAFLKSTFCVYRPWIKDARVKPLDSAFSGATGYSFPSGHATSSSSVYLPLAHKYKKHKGLVFFSIIMVLLTMFSRNYVGVHTPQDVLVGLLTGIISLFIVNAIEKYLNNNPNKDKTILIASTIIVTIVLIYVSFKQYPIDYVDGKILVDPNSMKINSFADPGTFYGVVLAWYLERRCVKIDISGTTYQKIMRCLIGGLSLVAYYTIVVKGLGKLININIIYFLLRASVPIIFMVLYPLTWKRK